MATLTGVFSPFYSDHFNLDDSFNVYYRNAVAVKKLIQINWLHYANISSKKQNHQDVE